MKRYIYDTQTGDIQRQTGAYNPAVTTATAVDAEGEAMVVVTPNPRYIVCREVVEAQPAYDRATQRLTSTTTVDEGLALIIRGWEVEPRPVPPEEPQWIAFGLALALDPTMGAFVSSLAANPQTAVLERMITGGLLQAAEGNSRTFLRAWEAAVLGGAITTELITSMQAMASAHDLPADFIAGLAPATDVAAEPREPT